MEKKRKGLDPRLAGMSRTDRERILRRALKMKNHGPQEGYDARPSRRGASARSWRDWMDEDPPHFERSRMRSRRTMKGLVDQILKEDGQGGAAVPPPASPGEAPGASASATEPGWADRPAGLRTTATCGGTGRTEEREGSRPSEPRRGTVLSVSPGACVVLTGDDEVRCALPDEIAASQKSSLAVGDEVRFLPRADGTGLLAGVSPRRTILSRPDPLLPERERVIACNIDVVVIVASVKTPPLRVRLIDRFLIAVERGGMRPALCVNKIDLDSTEERAEDLAKLEPYRAIGLPTVLTSAERGEGLDELRKVIRGKRCVMVGHSGVGKSSLLNALCPDLGLTTREVSEATLRGRHTTSASTLYRLPEGAEVIDTPGIRQFGLWELKREDLRWYFPEFGPYMETCRFRNCTHTAEPDCSVKRAVGTGKLPAARYETYRRILGTLGN